MMWYGYGYGYGSHYLTYLLFALPGLLLILYASAKVKSTFSKYSKVANLRGLTGRDAALELLRLNGITNVSVHQTQGSMTDYYDPRSNAIYLSETVYSSTSVAAVGVACHEAGHACQYAVGYGPIKLRMKILPLCRIGSQIGIPLMIVGAIFSVFGLVIAGIALFGLAVLFQVVTLPVEFNASRRALETISSSGMLNEQECAGAKKVLSAAAMTYVASMLQSMLMLLYYITRFTGNRRR